MSGGHGHEITGKEIFAKKRVRQKRHREEEKSRTHDQPADSDHHVSSKAPRIRPPDKQQAERKRDELEKAPHVYGYDDVSVICGLGGATASARRGRHDYVSRPCWFISGSHRVGRPKKQKVMTDRGF